MVSIAFDGVCYAGIFGMKGLLKKIHFSRKAVFITAGALLLLGASGGAALYFFADRVNGEQQAKAIQPNGVACMDVQSEIIRKVDRLWIRKYISVASSDGPDRVRTAMRLALAIQEKEKPDLVQVAVVDAKGPTKRADLRGRAIGANVVLVSNPAMLADGTSAAFSARFSDGEAGPDGLFYGQRVEMEEADAKAVAASIATRDLCGDMTGVPPGAHEPAPGDGQGEVSSSHDAPATGEHDAVKGEEHASAASAPVH